MAKTQRVRNNRMAECDFVLRRRLAANPILAGELPAVGCVNGNDPYRLSSIAEFFMSWLWLLCRRLAQSVLLLVVVGGILSLQMVLGIRALGGMSSDCCFGSWFDYCISFIKQIELTGNAVMTLLLSYS